MQVQGGTIDAVDGPVVGVAGATGLAMADLVEAGDERLVGEVVRLQGERATIQVYENTGGIRPGEPVFGTGGPISVELGPGLIGGIFDGLQRPLEGLEALAGPFISRGIHVPALDVGRAWRFVPAVQPGDTIGPGAILGTVAESRALQLRILAPPGRVEAIAAGEYRVGDVIARIAGEQGETAVTLAQRWPVRRPRPYRQRLRADVPLITGQRVIDTFFPIAKGGTAAIPGGFGTGKTVTQHQLAKWADADVIVYIGCGERGNEMTEVLIDFPKLEDPRSGEPLMQRTVLIANTSNMPVAAREISIYTGITIAEYYRDMGYQVALMADSTSRWAEALREIAGRLEELPAEEGFPAYLPARLAEFYERAGRVLTLGGQEGSISIVGAVSPPGGDFSEPVTQNTLRFVRCFWALDKNLAAARHFPAINWLTSYSEYVDSVTGWWRENVALAWREQRDRALALLQEEDRLQQIARLVGPDALPDEQRLVLETARIIREGFLQQNALHPVDTYTTPQKQVAMLRIILHFHTRAARIISRGAPVLRLRQLPIVEQLLRIKTDVPNEQVSRIEEIGNSLDQAMDELEREYLR